MGFSIPSLGNNHIFQYFFRKMASTSIETDWESTGNLGIYMVMHESHK
jgi:hypothetical protein